MEIRSLNGISIDEVYSAWNNAFAGYARTWTKEELENDLLRRGYAPELSFGAFDGNKLVAFTLNGIGEFNDTKTAYDTGTGTIKKYQGKGLAPKIFEHSLPYLKNAGITQYMLEVLQQNENAISVYTKLGFKISRELNYFVQDIDKVQLKNKVLPTDYKLEEANLSSKAEMEKMWDFTPSWQNNFVAIYRKQNDFKIVGVYNDKMLVGYGINEPSSGDITQLAVHKDHRRKGIGTVILKELLKYNKSLSMKLINTDVECATITKFLEANGIPKSGAQFEMIKRL
jgi:ribosomal protein S18 acetylase RimI-like enzyme